jgi:hypothetical protein
MHTPLLPRLWKASSISYEIDNYNAFAKSIATKITLSLLALLTSREKAYGYGTRRKTDYTHQKAYSLFVERIAP